MSLKDHPVFFTIAACVATAACTWTVSEQIRVAPVERKLQEHSEKNKMAPVISEVTLSRVLNNNSLIIELNTSYSDPDGDATFINFVVLKTNKSGIVVGSTTLNDSTEEQKSGANNLGTWDCGPAQYFVKFRTIITDRAGHASEPYDFTINCTGLGHSQ